MYRQGLHTAIRVDENRWRYPERCIQAVLVCGLRRFFMPDCTWRFSPQAATLSLLLVVTLFFILFQAGAVDIVPRTTSVASAASSAAAATLSGNSAAASAAAASASSGGQDFLPSLSHSPPPLV